MCVLAVVRFQIIITHNIERGVRDTDVWNAHSRDKLVAFCALQEVVYLKVRRLRSFIRPLHSDHSPIASPVKSDVLVLLAWKRSVQIIRRGLFFCRDIRILVRDVLAVNSRVDHNRSDKVIGDSLVYVGPLRTSRNGRYLASLVKLSADNCLASIDIHSLVAIGDNPTNELVRLLFRR